jgi:hypothetical protein
MGYYFGPPSMEFIKLKEKVEKGENLEEKDDFIPFFPFPSCAFAI